MKRSVASSSTVERGLCGEVELLERFGRWESGEPQSAGEPPFSGRGDFDVEQVMQELGVAGLGLLDLLERGRQLLGGGGELEVGEVAAQLLVGGVLVHRATLAICA